MWVSQSSSSSSYSSVICLIDQMSSSILGSGALISELAFILVCQNKSGQYGGPKVPEKKQKNCRVKKNLVDQCEIEMYISTFSAPAHGGLKTAEIILQNAY